MRMVCACLLLGALFSTAAAQSADAPALDPTTNVLYLHSETGQDMWMNAQETDGAATNICYTAPEATPIGDLCPNSGGSFSYVFELQPGLGGDILLDASGTIDFLIYWGGACCTVGTADYDMVLSTGETVIASTSGTHIMNPGAVSSVCPNDGCVYNAIEASLTPETDRILAADGLTLSITGDGEWTHAAISTTADRGASTITLPILAALGGQVTQPATAVVPEGVEEIGNTTDTPTNATMTFNWTAPAALHVAVNSTQGVAAINITVANANGTEENATVFTCECNGTVEQDVPQDSPRYVCVDQDVTPSDCRYTVRVELREFVGTWQIRAGTEASPSPVEPPEGNVTAGNATGNETLQGEDQESPVPVVVAFLAVGLVAWVRRR